MNDYERLGVFYLGRRFDVEKNASTGDLILFPSKNFVTHGMVVGMTGSGKTGLCFDIIEEAAIDGIPAILIDPKGDLTNLLLTFPNLAPEDFAPWVNEEDARKQGRSTADYAASQAEAWKQGLAAWEQDGERIHRLREASEFAIYTPGSSAGRPVSLLSSFAKPPTEVMEDMELLGDRVGSTVSGLLGLVGMEADPVNSRETILLSSLLQHAWSQGRDLDLGSLIHEVQQPSVTKLGVLDLESFYPANDRFALAMRLNNLLASPNFATWMEGEPLDLARLLYTNSGKPRTAIFSIAHLGDSERMFFVTALLNQVLAWMRAQSGTSSLRALVYMDEIFGYFPPVANPPSKRPLLSLLKQGRAFGVGVVLATQNPVDLDYKGLANIGTWFIGRLQTERDKARVLDGLQGAMEGRGAEFDRGEVDGLISRLPSRVFLLHSVHQDGFDVMESRWAMSYLRGPLNRSQIKALTSDQSDEPAATHAPIAEKPVHAPPAAVQTKPSGSRPVLPPAVPQFFAPARSATGLILYMPKLLGAALVRYSEPALQLDAQQEIVTITDITDSAVPVNWAEAEELALALTDLERTPVEAEYSAFVPAAAQVKNYDKWAKEFAAWIYGERAVSVLRSKATGLVSAPGEDQRDFMIRVQQTIREQRDDMSEKLRVKYAPKIAALQERIRRAQAAREREASQARRAKLDTVVSCGSTLLGAFLGRKAISSGTVGRAATTMRSAGRSMDQAGDVARAQGTIQALEKQLADLDAQFHEETAAATAAVEARSEELEKIAVRPKKTHIQVRLVALVWLPFVRDTSNGLTRAY